MDSHGQNGYRDPRIDEIMAMFKIVAAITSLSRKSTKLLIAQVLLTDRVDKLAVSVQELREEDMNHTDERLNALIAVVGIIHKPPSLK